MSGWGKADDKTSTGTLSIASDGAVTGNSTLFTTQAKVGDFVKVANIGAGSAETYEWIITSITDNTTATVAEADPARAYTAAYSTFSSAGTQNYDLSEKPKWLAYGDATPATSLEVYGVDTNEMAANKNVEGAAHAGWVHVRTNGSRKIVETLVAMSKNGITGDAEDVVFEDFLITITDQPVDSLEAAGEAVTFSVGASITGTGGTLTYAWQRDAGSGFVTIDGTIATAEGYTDYTADTLNVLDNTALDTYEFRCVVSATGADSVTSDAAVLTVAP